MELRHSISAGVFTTLIASASLAFADPQAQQAPRTPPAVQQAQPASQPPSEPRTTKRQAPAAATAPADERIGSLDARARRALATQVALDRAGFSPGELDAASGNNTKRALRVFQESRGLTATGTLDERTISSLGEVFNNPGASYAISAGDVAGPFEKQMPTDMMAKSKLPTLAYASVQELLAERFHASPKLLQRLNPAAKFEQGEVIIVPNVDPFLAPGLTSSRQQPTTATPQSSTTPQKSAQPGPPPPPDAARAGGTPTKGTDATRAADTKPAASTAGNVVTVSDKDKSLTVQNAAGETVFFAPVTVGSKNDPLPVGEWKVNGVSRSPTFNYNPDLFWDADPAHAKAKIPAGPNNPVGVVWIDLSKEHYGIHGTPEPSRIGYTESHGCIRLTNWDAMRLATLVAPGTKVVLQ